MAPLNVHIKSSNDAKFTVSVEDTDSVLTLKTVIATSVESSANPAPVEGQRLIFAGRVLKDEEVLATYKIIDGSTVHLVRGGIKAAAPSPTATAPDAASPAAAIPPSATAATPQAATTTPAASTVPANPLAGNPLAAALLGGAGAGTGLGGLPGGFPGIGEFGVAGAGAGGARQPGMDEFVNNPAMSAAMAQMMADPHFMEIMMANNPQFANMPPQMREFMRSDQFRQIMSNPDTLRAMMQMAPLMGGGMNPFAPANMGAGTGGAGANPFAGPNANPMNPTGAGGFDPALMQMLMGGAGGLGGLGGAGQPPLAPPPANPEEAYQVQLRQLQDMGFYDAAENIRALTATRGNVEAALEWLFNNPPPGHR